jgi:transcriptional regulator with XRE-family HTH domain
LTATVCEYTLQLGVEDMEVIQFQRELREASNINKPLVARLRSVMLKKGLNPKTLAERSNVGRSFVYDILNGKSANPTSAKLTAIAEQLGVSVQYLLSGVYAENSDGKSEIAEIPTLITEPKLDGQMAVTTKNDKFYCFKNNWIKEKLATTAQNLRAINVVGDSMTPTLQNGDVILININQTMPNPPGLFVLFDGLGLHAKRLEQIGKDKIRVMSDNAQYQAYEMDVQEINIIGKIVWLGREL